MNALLYTLAGVAVVAAVVWIGWRLFQFAHRKTGEESEQHPAETHRDHWPWSTP